MNDGNAICRFAAAISFPSASPRMPVQARQIGYNGRYRRDAAVIGIDADTPRSAIRIRYGRRWNDGRDTTTRWIPRDAATGRRATRRTGRGMRYDDID